MQNVRIIERLDVTIRAHKIRSYPEHQITPYRKESLKKREKTETNRTHSPIEKETRLRAQVIL